MINVSCINREDIKTRNAMGLKTFTAFWLNVFLMISGNANAEEPVIPVIIATELGVIEAELYPDRAPITVANFLDNIDAGLYQAGHFYRALNKTSGPLGPLALIQGGKALTSEGRPPIAHETTTVSGLSHTEGVLSMARLAPGTASSEFFICNGNNTGLDTIESDLERQGYAAFGRVTEGMDVVRHILTQPVGNRAPDDPFSMHVKEQGIDVLLPSLLNHSIPMRVERRNRVKPITILQNAGDDKR